MRDRNVDGTATTESTYATGGGGVSLEHAFGATLLAALLTGDPLPELGDAFAVVEVAFQAGRETPVDDFVIAGRHEGGDVRTVAVAVRRHPTIGPSDEKFVSLVHDMVGALGVQPDEFESASRRLLLAVAGPQRPARELASLADMARRQRDDAAFRSAAGAASGPLRERLRLFGEVVAKALPSPDGTTDELPWRLLRSLHVREVFLEEPDTRDRTAAIQRLTSITENLERAAVLWARLCELAATYDPAGATVDEAMLRRDLTGSIAIRASYRHALAARRLEELTSVLEYGVGRQLCAGDQALTLPRTAQTEAIRQSLAPGTATLVRGEPDTGKSALAAAAAGAIRDEGGVVYGMRLTDLPARAGDLSGTFGEPIADALAGAPVGSQRVLWIDAAEAVQEGHRDTLATVTRAAVRAGFALVAVARDDAAAQVREALVAAGVSGDPRSVAEVVVPAFADEELAQVIAVFPDLRALDRDARSAWLLRRPGLVDLLLRAGSALGLPVGPLSEADVFTAVWRDLVRNREVRAPGSATPDGRQAVLLDLASARLGLPTTPPRDGVELASLRSDGLLAPLTTTAPWSEDSFARDLVRDFAVAALLLREPRYGLLAQAAAPRWAVRAARLAAQVRIHGADDPEGELRRIRAELDAVARDYGERWTDVAWEAVLLLGDASLLRAVWVELERDEHSFLRRLMRIVDQRFASGGAADPVVAGPLASVVVEHLDTLLSGDREERRETLAFVRAWLLGLAPLAVRDVSDVDRQALREQLLFHPLRDADEQLELLASLGADIDERVIARLRLAAGDEPQSLAKAVEEITPRVSLAVHHHELLIELADAYYIKRPRRRRRRGPWDDETDDFGASPLDDFELGLRGHRPRRSLPMQLRAPFLGPFRELLVVNPVAALAFINQMLDHAARYVVGRGRPVDDDGLPHLDLDLAGLGSRSYVGDPNVWTWYRGSTVGPYPAMSALMAAEDWADGALVSGVPMQRLVQVLLRDCHNLAMVGLVTGLLTRHVERATQDLEVLLSEPAVWQLEFGRTTHEMSPLARRDEETRPGAGRRRFTPRETAGQLVLNAVLSGNREREEELRTIGDALDRAADALPDPKSAAAVRTWAAGFRREHYEPTVEDGVLRIAYVPPTEAAAALRASNAELARGQEAWRLQTWYSVDSDPANQARVVNDLAVARDLLASPPEGTGPDPLAGPAAAASAAIRAHATGKIELSREDLVWALSTLCVAAESTPERDQIASGRSTFLWGADRSAAAALPLALLPGLDAVVDEVGSQRVWAAMRQLFTAGIDEVRRIAAAALRPVWDAPCGRSPDGRCRHERALDHAVEGARYVRLGPYGRDGRREIRPFDGPLEKGLRRLKPQDMLIDPLVAPVIAAADAAFAATCITARAGHTLEALLEAHLRAAPYYAERHYDTVEIEREAFVAALIRLAAADQTGLLRRHVDALLVAPDAIATLLGDALRLATYDPDRRADMRRVWPGLMEWLLDAYGAGTLRVGRGWLDEGPIAAVVPAPEGRISDPHIDRTIDAVAGDWIDVEHIHDLVDRWLPIAAGSARCVDGLVGFIRTQPVEVQLAVGLPWVGELVRGHGSSIARRSFLLVEWLESLRRTGRVQGVLRGQYQVIVDALVTGGDSRAAALQALEE